MPQRQRHRGRHPQDDALFAPSQIPTLRDAVSDLSLLRTRDYAERAALKLVGDHYQLTTRQRRAVLGASCPDASLRSRAKCFIVPDRLAGATLAVDGYNQLIITESVLSGAVLLRGRDGCLRDLASVHGSYRRVEETLTALRLLGNVFADLRVKHVNWFFDAPVSNSGRLRALLQAEARSHNWPWDVAVEANVDKTLANSANIVVTSDGWILDRAHRWTRIDPFVLHAAGAADRAIDLGKLQPTDEDPALHDVSPYPS